MTNPTPTPRLVPDRPSARVAEVLIELASYIEAVPVSTVADWIDYITAAAPPAEAPAERGAVLEIVAKYVGRSSRIYGYIRDDLAQLAAAPAAPATVPNVCERCGKTFLELHQCATPMFSPAPRVTGGREAQDAARYTWLRCGGWEVMQDPAMWPEALRFDGAIDAAMALVALQAANGGAVQP